uniref:Uncharacterized protein n=1 Tax=Magallana gigas TaxID=29159 RepID=K1QNS8_MAGGI
MLYSYLLLIEDELDDNSEKPTTRSVSNQSKTAPITGNRPGNGPGENKKDKGPVSKKTSKQDEPESDTEISKIPIDSNFAGVSKRHSPHNGTQKKNSEMQLDLNSLSIRGEEEPKTSTSVPEMAAMPSNFANRRTMRSLNAEQEQEVVDAHNAARLRASGSNMMKMIVCIMTPLS